MPVWSVLIERKRNSGVVYGVVIADDGVIGDRR
jgi:hypothetical protein